MSRIFIQKSLYNKHSSEVNITTAKDYVTLDINYADDQIVLFGSLQDIATLCNQINTEILRTEILRITGGDQ